MTTMPEQFQPGDRVTLVRGIGGVEKDLINTGLVRFTVKRIDKTHGYVVVEDEHGAWHVHPEALRKEPELRPGEKQWLRELAKGVIAERRHGNRRTAVALNGLVDAGLAVCHVGPRTRTWEISDAGLEAIGQPRPQLSPEAKARSEAILKELEDLEK